jgi:hypothetical protein
MAESYHAPGREGVGAGGGRVVSAAGATPTPS